MTHYLGQSGLMAMLLIASLAVHGQPNTDSIAIDTLATASGQPLDVQLIHEDETLIIQGRVQKSGINHSRRLMEPVNIEFMDKSGNTLTVKQTDVNRITPAKHTSQGQFALELPALPPGTHSLRVSYGR